MRLTVNGTERELEGPLTVKGLLEALDIDQRYGAVEVNREVVPRSEHGEHRIEDGDEVEIIRFVGGGT